MRTLLGALVGLGLGSLLMAVLISQGMQSYWPIVLVGLIAGVTVRSFSKEGRGGYIGGGLAAIVTVVALVTGPLLATKVIAMQLPETPVKNDAVAVAADNANEESDTAAAEVEEEPVVEESATQVPRALRYGSPRNQKFPVLDAIFLAVGCLVAYEIGKGKAKKSEAGEEPSQEPTMESEDSAEEA